MPEPKRAPQADAVVDETKPTLERERTSAPEISIEIPTSKGEVVAGPDKTSEHAETPSGVDQEARARRENGAPGREATDAEARARLGSLQFDAETTERIGDMLGHAAEQAELHGIRDEIDDADALRIAGQADAPAIANEPRMEAIPDFNRRNDDFGPPEIPVAPTTLPAVVQTLPAFVNNDISWLKMHQLPGYVVNHIRALGRTTFRSFPCFAEHERKERGRGIPDPMATITLVANFPGQNGPSDARELDQMARWISENGVMVDADVLEFPVAFPGYRPEIALLVTADDSFLMVRDTIANGAPVEGIYIYRWKGGANSYRLADGRVHLGQLDAGPAADRPHLAAPPRQLGAPGRGMPRQPRDVGPLRARIVAGPIARNNPEDLRRVQEVIAPGRPLPVMEGQVVRKKGISKALPVASDSTQVLAAAQDLKRLRDAGFAPHATAEGPGLRFEHVDGRTFHLQAEPGKRLLDTTAFRMRVTSAAGGDPVVNDAIGVDDILAEIAPSGPKP